MNRHLSLPWMGAGLIGLLCLTGCPPKKKLTLQDKTTPPAAAANQANAAAGVRIETDWTDIPQLADAHFDLDKSNLNDAARATLKSNISFIKKLPASVMIRVEGHCDDRGTVEYNIALGQRRANAVRSYYVAAGIPRKRIETISFGEERPLCREESEDCWARNRRGSTKVRNKEPLTINPESVTKAVTTSPAVTQ